jgi:hypothetical protein
MRARTDASNYYRLRLPAEKFDEFITSKEKEGIVYTYRDIVLAILVRMFKVRPRLNQFVSAGRFYQRNNIDLSMVVHKSLRSGDQESIIKVRFTGYETIAEIKQRLEAEVARAIHETNEVDGFTSFLATAPFWLVKLFARAVRLLDHCGMWSDNFLFKNSPFHSSIFYADMKSVKLDYTFHHLNNFGNCGFFLTLGKEHTEAGFDNNGNVVPKKFIECGVTEDERFIDGLYFSRMIKAVHRIIDDLTVLERPLEEREIYPLKTWKELKAERKAKKKAKQAAKKAKREEEKAAKKSKKAA